ncbi:hypothetical protein T01_8779 [Trichinella spiralis]|uniref:Uncharacterized protein n=1 Tax=Trichinella spiralis TaxID=6334 RepID=A0A0V1BHU8_TRISP|nr:hypothetical protein T01_8779 [Trichinella spiralis]
MRFYPKQRRLYVDRSELFYIGTILLYFWIRIDNFFVNSSSNPVVHTECINPNPGTCLHI